MHYNNSRCSFQQILKAYQRLNASQWVIGMHVAFLCNRKMSVKVGNHLSEPQDVTGGAVQGSVLGVLDHNAALENLDDNISLQTEKYVDDVTLVEIVPGDVGSMVDNSVSPPMHTFKPEKTKKTLINFRKCVRLKD